MKKQQVLKKMILCIKGKVMDSTPEIYTHKMMESDNKILSKFSYDYANIEESNILGSVSDWFPEFKEDKEIRFLESLASSDNQTDYKEIWDEFMGNSKDIKGLSPHDETIIFGYYEPYYRDSEHIWDNYIEVHEIGEYLVYRHVINKDDKVIQEMEYALDVNGNLYEYYNGQVTSPHYWASFKLDECYMMCNLAKEPDDNDIVNASVLFVKSHDLELSGIEQPNVKVYRELDNAFDLFKKMKQTT